MSAERIRSGKQSDQGYASLQKGLLILQHLQRRGRAKISDISEELEIPTSTTYRYAGVLKEAGFVVENDGYLVPTHYLAESESFGTVSQTLVTRGARILDELRDELGMTALLTTRIHLVAVSLAVAYSHAKHLVSFGRGEARSLYAGASALPLLAYAPAAVENELLSGNFKPYTALTLTHEMIQPYLEDLRRKGYAMSTGHLTPGMAGIGVPVIVKGECICALSVVGEEPNLRNNETRVADRIKEAANKLSNMFVEDLSTGVSLKIAD